jgi:hypothetical protein
MRLFAFLVIFIPFLLFSQNLVRISENLTEIRSGEDYFDPDDGNVTLLLRADMGITLVDDSVGTWTDQISAIAFTAVSGARPLYNSSVPRIEFDGVDDQLINAAPASWMDLTNTQVYTMEVHYYTDDTGASLRMIGRNLNSNNTMLWYQGTSDDLICYMRDASVTGIQATNIAGATPADGTTRTVSWTLSARGSGAENPATTFFTYVNGIPTTTNLIANNNTTTFSYSDAVDIPYIPANGLDYYVYAIRYSKVYRTPAEILAFHNWCVATFGE